MKPVVITSYGHACYKVTCGSESVLFDPYANGSVPGLKLPEGISASKVYCSHSHSDHNARDLISETATLSDPFNAVFLSVPHDDCGGAKRGYSDITILDVCGVKVIHFGDIGRLPSDDEYGQLKGADVVLIPVGGFYTIDAAQAAAIVRRLHPKLTVLMHYRTDTFGYDVLSHIDDVKKEFPDMEQLPDSEVTFTGEEKNRVVTLKPVQE